MIYLLFLSIAIFFIALRLLHNFYNKPAEPVKQYPDSININDRDQAFLDILLAIKRARTTRQLFALTGTIIKYCRKYNDKCENEIIDNYYGAKERKLINKR
jgi:hypothetical protein